jgi:cytochrome d ubiquinol oxidase subunit I
VQGLAVVEKSKQPPLYIHTFFDIKLTLIAVLMAIMVAFVAVYKFKPKWLAKTWLLASVGVSGVLAIAVIELGWMMTEIGRQPWAVRGYVTTEQALTKTNDITTFGFVFPAAYVVLFAVTVLAVRKIVKDEPNTTGVKK